MKLKDEIILKCFNTSEKNILDFNFKYDYLEIYYECKNQTIKRRNCLNSISHNLSKCKYLGWKNIYEINNNKNEIL